MITLELLKYAKMGVTEDIKNTNRLIDFYKSQKDFKMVAKLYQKLNTLNNYLEYLRYEEYEQKNF